MYDRIDRQSQIGLAETLGLLESWNLPPEPKNYKLAYLYLEGTSRALRTAIDAIYLKDSRITRDAAAKLCRDHIDEERRGERIELVGDQLAGELEQVVGVLEASTGTRERANDMLEKANERLANRIDRQALSTVIDSIASVATDSKKENIWLSAYLRRFHHDILKLQGALAAVGSEALVDSLTGVANRKRLNGFLSEAMTVAKRCGEPLSLLLVDVDKFKQFNDIHGHLTGDQVLRLIAGTLEENVKGRDLVARCGGEEFAVVLPSTSLAQAGVVAQKLRRAVAAKELVKRSTAQRLGRVTISIGAAEMAPHHDRPMLIELTEQMLSLAKRAGCNSVWPPEQSHGVAVHAAS